MTQIILVKKSELWNNPTTHPPTTSHKRAYLISNLNNFSWDVNTPVSPMPLPEDSHEANILVKMEGNSAQLNISWTITEGDFFGDYDIDSNTFTATDGDLSPYKQITEFKDTFIPTEIKDGYALYVIDENASGNDKGLLSDEGTISSLKFDVSGQSPVVWNANLQFMVGDVVSLFEADVPERPRSVTISKPTSLSRIKVEWVAFTSFADVNDAVPVTGVEVQYKKGNDGWKSFTESDLMGSQRTANGGDGLGCDDCNTPFTPTSRTFNVDSGTYKIRLTLNGNNTSESGIKQWRNGKTSSGFRDLVI